MAREAELQRRATIRKLQLEQSQAVMRNRNWAMQSPMAQEPGWPSRLHAIELRPKARRRDFDDGHSTSSSDVHSISTMSVTSLSTTDSDSGPSLRTPPSIFSSLREASSSSLLEPFDDFPFQTPQICPFVTASPGHQWTQARPLTLTALPQSTLYIYCLQDYC